MKTLLSFSILLLSTFFSNAQLNSSNEFSYQLSEPYQLIEGSKSYFSKDNYVVTLKKAKKKFFLQKMNMETMKEEKRVEMEIPFEFNHYGTFTLGDRHYIIYQKWDRKERCEQLFARELDFDNCKLAETSRLLIRFKGKIAGGRFSFEMSNNQSMLLAKYRRVPESRNDRINKDVIGMYVFNDEMETISGGEYTMPYTEVQMNNIDYTVDRQGNAFILTEVFRDGSTKRYTESGDPNYHLELIMIDTDKHVSNKVIKLSDKFVKQIQFTEGKNQELTLAGFYANDKNAGSNGFFYAKIVDDEISDIRYYDVPTDVMKKYTTEKEQKSMEKAENKGKEIRLNNYRIRKIDYSDDGDVSIYAEQYYVVSTRDSKTNTVTRTYYYKDILGIGVDQDGELLWMDRFPKNQMGLGYHSLGFIHVANDTFDYLLFMDHKNNADLALDQYPEMYWNGSSGLLTGLKIEKKTGKAERISSLDFDNVNGMILTQFSTSRMIQLNDMEFAVECTIKKPKNDIMLKVTIE